MTIEELRKRLDGFNSSSYYEQFKRNVARGGLELTRRCFQDETDPYGSKWAYVPDHPGHQAVEKDSGALEGSFRWQPLVDGLRFYSAKVYAARQNYGYRKTGQPGRRMLPTGRLGLPYAWKIMVRAAAIRALRSVLGQ